MYTPTKTWAAGPWPFSDANVYIRDNQNSVRNYQTGPQMFVDSNASLGTTNTIVGTHLALLAATPDENYEMQVLISLGFSTVAGGGANLTCDILDQSSVSITMGGARTFQVTGYTGAGYGNAVILGKGSYGSGVNPGFQTQLRLAPTGTVNVWVMSHCWFRPLI